MRHTKERRSREKEEEIGMTQPQAKVHLESPEAERGKEGFEPLEKAWLCQ